MYVPLLYPMDEVLGGPFWHHAAVDRTHEGPDCGEEEDKEVRPNIWHPNEPMRVLMTSYLSWKFGERGHTVSKIWLLWEPLGNLMYAS